MQAPVMQHRSLAVRAPAARSSSRFQTRTQALFGMKNAAVVEKPASKKKEAVVIDKAAEYKKRQSLFSNVTSALDFAEVRSKSDAELLYDAKYGELKDGKMTKEQYQALRRRVVGTAKDFWKTSVDVKGEYTDKGYVSSKSTASGVPGLPFLVLTVLGMFATLAVVVAQTS